MNRPNVAAAPRLPRGHYLIPKQILTLFPSHRPSSMRQNLRPTEPNWAGLGSNFISQSLVGGPSMPVVEAEAASTPASCGLQSRPSHAAMPADNSTLHIAEIVCQFLPAHLTAPNKQGKSRHCCETFCLLAASLARPQLLSALVAITATLGVRHKLNTGSRMGWQCMVLCVSLSWHPFSDSPSCAIADTAATPADPNQVPQPPPVWQTGTATTSRLVPST